MDLEALRGELQVAMSEQAALSSALKEGLDNGFSDKASMQLSVSAAVAAPPTAPKLCWGASSSRAIRSQRLSLSSGHVQPSPQIEIAAEPPFRTTTAQTADIVSAISVPKDVSMSSDLVRKHVLKEVLTLVLGDISSSHLDHIQLTPESVASIMEEKKKRSVIEARNEAEKKASTSAAEKLTRSLKEAHDKFAKDHALMSAGFEAKESALKAQLASLQRLLETSKLEKKQLDGKLAQVGRDLRSQGETIKDLQHKLMASEKNAEKHARIMTKTLAESDKARVEGERREREVEAKAQAAEIELALAKQAMAQEVESSKTMKSVMEHQLMELHDAKLMIKDLTTSIADTESSHALTLTTLRVAHDEYRFAALQSLEDAQQGLQDFVSVFEGQLSGLREDLTNFVKVPLSGLFSMTHSEILSTREEFGNMHVAIIQAMSHLQCQRDEAQAQVSKLIAESGILSALGGTVGLLHIQEELVKAREKAEELETKLTMNDLARSQLEAMKLQLEAEVRLSSQSQAEVRRELTACESRLEEATRELKVALNRAESAESQAAQAMEETRCERISADEIVKSYESRIKSITEEHKKTELQHSGILQELNQARLDVQQLSADIRLAEKRGGIQAANDIQIVQSRYFQDAPIAFGKLPSSAWGVTPNSDPDAGAVCKLSHEQLVELLQGFIQRQALALTGEGTDGTSSALELLWLEGSILQLLVEFRRQERLLAASTPLKATAGLPKIPRPRVADVSASTRVHVGTEPAGSVVGGSPARSLASQMIRATEKAELQKKLKTSVLKESPAPFIAYAPLRRSISERNMPFFQRPQSEGSHKTMSDAFYESMSTADSLGLHSVMERRRMLTGPVSSDLGTSGPFAPQRRISEPCPSPDAGHGDSIALIAIPADTIEDTARASYDVDEVLAILDAEGDQPVQQRSWRGGWKSGGGVRSLGRPSHEVASRRQALQNGRLPVGPASLVRGNGTTNIHFQAQTTLPIDKQRHRSADGRMS